MTLSPLTDREAAALRVLINHQDHEVPAWIVCQQLGLGIRAGTAALRGLRQHGLAVRCGGGRYGVARERRSAA